MPKHRTTLAFVVAVITSMILTVAARTPSALAQSRGASALSAADGRVVFEEHCIECHSGAQNYAPHGPLPSAMRLREPAARRIIRRGITRERMPAFPAAALSERDLGAVVAYLRSQGGVR